MFLIGLSVMLSRETTNYRTNIFSPTLSLHQSQLFFSHLAVSHSSYIVLLIVTYISLINPITHCGINGYSRFTLCNYITYTASFLLPLPQFLFHFKTFNAHLLCFLILSIFAQFFVEKNLCLFSLDLLTSFFKV